MTLRDESHAGSGGAALRGTSPRWHRTAHTGVGFCRAAGTALAHSLSQDILTVHPSLPASACTVQAVQVPVTEVCSAFMTPSPLACHCPRLISL